MLLPQSPLKMKRPFAVPRCLPCGALGVNSPPSSGGDAQGASLGKLVLVNLAASSSPQRLLGAGHPLPRALPRHLPVSPRKPLTPFFHGANRGLEVRKLTPKPRSWKEAEVGPQPGPASRASTSRCHFDLRSHSRQTRWNPVLFLPSLLAREFCLCERLLK